MKSNEVIVKRQKYTNRFKNEDMDFVFNWAVGVTQIIGLSAAQVYEAVRDIQDGDAAAWRAGFYRQGECQLQQAHALSANHQLVAAGQSYLGAAYAYRFGLQYASPTAPDFDARIEQMEQAFQTGMELLNIPLTPIEVPFENTTLPGYYLEHDRSLRPTVIMIGGGDSYREDLFYCAGYPGWKRGYNVLMIDLPGQGKVPGRGQHCRVDMEQPIKVVVDWLLANAAIKPEQIALYGISGGGYFTALAAAADPRITAWIASTPIFDMAEVFRREFGPTLKAPGWALNLFMRLAGKVNDSAELNLEKYVWQFGTTDFKSTVDQILAQARVVDVSGIQCPSLLLVSEGEADELKRQSHETYRRLRERAVDVTLREFTAAEGADGHCQMTNLRLAQLVVFDWLDRVFGHDSGEVRLRC